MSGSSRGRIVARIADHLIAQPADHRLRVAIDGITAAGKTTLAAELTDVVRARGRRAEHLSTDDFHHVRARRYQQGRTSALGYYQDAYDLETFRRFVLYPLGPDGDRRYPSFAAARDRGSHRDAEAFGGVNEAAAALDQRYRAASRFYLDEVDPAARASIVVGNDDLARPTLRRVRTS